MFSCTTLLLSSPRAKTVRHYHITTDIAQQSYTRHEFSEELVSNLPASKTFPIANHSSIVLAMLVLACVRYLTTSHRSNNDDLYLL
jgi:hypothetical protein